MNSIRQKLLKSTSILAFFCLMGMTSYGFVQVSSVQQITTSPTDCDTITYVISGTLGASNYTYTGITWSVSGSTLTIDVNYTSGGIILPVIVQFTQTGHLTGVSSGNYTVVVRGMLNGSASSTFNGAPSINVVTCCATKANFTAGAVSYCKGDTVALSNISTASTSQVWYANNVAVDTNFNFSQLATIPGNYTYKLVASSPCGKDSIEKNVLILDDLKMPNDTAICLNDPLTLSAPAGWDAYSWSDRSRKQTTTVTQSGTYHVTVTANSGCTQVDSVKVDVVGPAFSLGPDTFFCYQGNLTLDAGAVWDTVSWLLGPTNRFLNVDSAGVYVATVTNSIGCQFIDAIKVVESGATIDVIGSDTVCPGDTVHLEVIGNDWNQFQWSNGGNTQKVAALTAGTWTVTATNQDGCVREDTAWAGFFALPFVDLGEDTTLCIGDSMLLDVTQANSTYLWQDSSMAPTATIDTAGTYYVTVISAEGCANSDSITVGLQDCDTVVEEPDGVEEFGSKENWVVYPNPSTGQVYLQNPNGDKPVAVEVYGVTGNLVYSNQQNLTSGPIRLNLEALSGGTWFIHIIGKDYRQVYPIQLLTGR